MYLFFLCIIFSIVLFIGIFGYFAFYYKNLHWEFVKNSHSQINSSITNSSKKLFTGNLDISVFSSLTIIEKTALDFHPNSKLFRGLKSRTKFFLLTITIPHHLLTDNDINDQFYLAIDSSKEFVELLKNLFVKWITIT